MKDQSIPSQSEIAALRIQRAAAVQNLYNALLTALEESEEGDRIEVSIVGIADSTVDAAIAKFAGSDWTVSRKEGVAKLQILQRVAATTPAQTVVVAAAEETGAAIVAADNGGADAAPEPSAAVVAKPIPMTSFRVCRVSAAHSPHPATTLANMFESVLSGQRLDGDRGCASTDLPKTTLEAVSDGQAAVVNHFPIHGLVSAADLAFRQHYPLMLTPDHICLTVTHGLAAYIAQDPEKWRQQFASHQGKALIRIIRNEFVKGSAANDWAGCFAEFSDAIRSYIGDDTHGLIICDFATTGPVEKAVSQIVLMDSMQSYFAYRVATRCGIPEIILKGEVADWQKLATKVRQLNERYPDLNSWLRHVIEIADKLAAAAAGNADTRYFEDIYKQNSESGGERINGWLLKLFPFCKDWRENSKLMVNPLLESLGASIRHDQLISPVSKVPFTWEYFGTEIDYEFLGGIVAVEQDPATLALSPRCAWGVRPKA